MIRKMLFNAETSDFDQMPSTDISISDGRDADIRLYTRNDLASLEHGERIVLTFTTDNTILKAGLERLGEFLRDSAIVNIIDTDCKKHS